MPKSITSAAQLAGKSVGVLVGSSEDYELLGYLGLEHLTGKVKVVSFPDENVGGRRGRIRRGQRGLCLRRPGGQPDPAKGYHPLVNAEQIAKLGIPGLNVIAVASNLVKNDPALVQDYVCAEVRGSQRHDRPAGRPST